MRCTFRRQISHQEAQGLPARVYANNHRAVLLTGVQERNRPSVPDPLRTGSRVARRSPQVTERFHVDDFIGQRAQIG